MAIVTNFNNNASIGYRTNLIPIRIEKINEKSKEIVKILCNGGMYRGLPVRELTEKEISQKCFLCRFTKDSEAFLSEALYIPDDLCLYIDNRGIRSLVKMNELYECYYIERSPND